MAYMAVQVSHTESVHLIMGAPNHYAGRSAIATAGRHIIEMEIYVESLTQEKATESLV